ncbi:MAG: hypothetical protein LC723_13165, partial [Actinobacteria bacterium]|nr:hypothetical protein [Actinomycetota bacterium]
MSSSGRALLRAARAVFAVSLLASLVVTTTARADLIKSGRTSLVSSSSDGTAGDGGRPSISADGRYVAFGSWDRLSPQDTDNNSDIYIKDTLTGTT